MTDTILTLDQAAERLTDIARAGGDYPAQFRQSARHETARRRGETVVNPDRIAAAEVADQAGVPVDALLDYADAAGTEKQAEMLAQLTRQFRNGKTKSDGFFCRYAGFRFNTKFDHQQNCQFCA